MREVSNAHGKVLLVLDGGRQFLKCPVCGRPLLIDDGKKWKLKTRIVIFLNGKTLAKCKYCRHDSEVPIKFDHDLMASQYGKKEVSIEPDSD